MWADRILTSAIATQLLGAGWASRDDLERIAAAWRAWAADPEAARRALDECTGGGSFVDWIQARHDDDAVERELSEHVHTWFGA